MSAVMAPSIPDEVAALPHLVDQIDSGTVGEMDGIGCIEHHEIGAAADGAWNTGAIETLRDAVRTQGEKTGVAWADALSSTVRPVITYWFMALYCAAKSATFAAVLSSGSDWGSAVLHVWTEADQALWAGVLNFWFLGRVFDKVRP